MERNIFLSIVLFIVIALIYSCATQKKTEEDKKNYGQMAWEKSSVPIRPGVPGKAPFWNVYAERFIYAPAFDYKTFENASTYRYEIRSQSDSSMYQFEREVPYAPLSPVWAKMPVGPFQIKVVGVSENGDRVGLAGEGQYYRASPYDPDDGIYYEPVMPYDSSAMVALDQLMHKDYVNYWLKHKSPDPDYELYRYANKLMSALVIGAVAHVKLTPDEAEAKRSASIATIVADYLLRIREPKGSPLEYFPATYHGYNDVFERSEKSHMQYNHTMVPYAADAGVAFLDLYNLTGEKKYFKAAKKIAQTFLQTQLENGTWYLLVNNNTGKPVKDILAIPTRIINYFNRLANDYGMKGLEQSTQRALMWTMNNPAKTFNWHAQFEDVRPTPPYKNLSREQACGLATYLFKNKKNIALAETLVRFAEDQFVIWEDPMEIAIREAPGYHSKNWFTPSVQEQYFWWMPVARSAGIMIETYWHAYEATDKKIYLAKAKSIANSITQVQKIYDGIYPTYFTEEVYPLNIWLNNIVWPAKVMMTFEDNLKGLNK